MMTVAERAVADPAVLDMWHPLAVTCDETQFHLDGRITGYEGTDVVSERTWEEDIPRIAY